MFFETTYVPSPQNSPNESISDWRPPSGSLSEEDLHSDTSSDSSMSESPVDHLIFVIHGIGQQTEQYGHFYEHIDNLRETTRQVLQAKIPDHSVRIELIPIEWHRHIHEQTDPTMNRITLKSIPTIRLIENDYLADVLYYFSKERGQSIIDNVTNLFNTSYHNFLKKHPDFTGQIAIIGYSLGGIIVWDILSHQRQPSSSREEQDYQKVIVKFPKLDFKPHYFFGFGSPLGAVLTIRGQSPVYYHPDEDIIFENVFHPFDPLAYRFEPLVNEAYTDEAAVLVKRSIPIGPTFSFPSMPSFPGTSFLSFFSWKASSQMSDRRSSQDSAEGTQEAANAVAKATKAASDADAKVSPTAKAPSMSIKRGQSDRQASGQEDQSSKLKYSMSAFWQYFSPANSTSQAEKAEGKGKLNSAPDLLEDKLDFIRQDSLHEEISHGILGISPDKKPKKVTEMKPEMYVHPSSHIASHHYEPSKPKMRQRSRSFSTTKEATAQTNSVRPKLKSQNTSTRSRRRHLVEVLGIDGIPVEAFEREHLGFQAPTMDTELPDQNSDNPPENQTESNGKRQSPISYTIIGSDGNEDPGYFETAQAHATECDASCQGRANQKHAHSSQNKNSGQRNLWEDLNQELNEPGPAIKNPGQSKASVAKEATRTGDESKDQQSESAERTNEKSQERLDSLPHRRRIDYVLQPEGFMSMIANEYLVGLRAHFSYWTNKDLLWHIVERLENIDDGTN